MSLGRQFRIDLKYIIAPITNPESAILVAYNDQNNLVASVAASKHSTELARLALLAVDQRYQRDGIGREVLSYAENYCLRTWGVMKIGLNALSTREELILWYMRCGYEKTGQLTPFRAWRDDNMAVRDDLHFVELEKVLP